MKRLSRFLAATNQPFPATNLHAAERCVPNPWSSDVEAVRQEQGNGGRISGPSFLGLNSQPENNSDVEYLLEDQPSGGGLRKVLLLVVLAAILGLLFMQWRSSFKASPKPPTPAKSDPSTPANAPQGNNQPSDPVGPAVTDAPKKAASGTNAGTTGTASDAKRRFFKLKPRLLNPNLQRPSLQRWKPQRPAHWLVAQTKARPQQSPRLKNRCQTPTEKWQKKRVSLTTSRALPWCGPSNTFRHGRCTTELRTGHALPARSYRQERSRRCHPDGGSLFQRAV